MTKQEGKKQNFWAEGPWQTVESAESEVHLKNATPVNWIHYQVIASVKNLNLKSYFECFWSLTLASETSGLMHNRGFVATRFCGRTDTATTKDPLGTPERGRSSTRTQSCGIDNQSQNKNKNKSVTTKQNFGWVQKNVLRAFYLWKFKVHNWIWYNFFDCSSHSGKAVVTIQQFTCSWTIWSIFRKLHLCLFNSSSVVSNCKLWD